MSSSCETFIGLIMSTFTHNMKHLFDQKSVFSFLESLIIDSRNHSHFEFGGKHTKSYDLPHHDRVLTLLWSNVEALNEFGEKEEDHLTTKNLTETRTLS